MSEEMLELLDALQAMVYLHCDNNDDPENGAYHSGFNNTDAATMRLLGRYGRMVIKTDIGRWVKGDMA